MKTQPNYIYKAVKTPNDPGIEGVYAMNNTGQTGGTIDADIDAFEAWDVATGKSTIIVGIIDSGIDFDHPDLADNMWINSGEIAGNGIDDDGNGYVDDMYGWDWAYGDNTPSDYCGHGTHCAGTIGAAGNNGIGVAGVNWNVKLMALKFLDDYGSGTTSGAVAALEYAAQMGALLTSNSWGGGSYDEALKTAIENSNMLFIAAAGNDDMDNDIYPHYPSSYDLDNIIAVAATDHNDAKAYFSCYGLESVDLAAPGVDILSTKPDNYTDIIFDSPGWGLSSTYYGKISGTSMATPAVSGAAALIYSRNKGLHWSEVKSVIMDNVDPIPAMEGITVTGGRLNVFNAIVSVGSGISVSPDTLDFGLVGISENSQKTLTFTNWTDSSLYLDIESNESAFTPFSNSIEIPANEFVNLDVEFIPVDVRDYSGILTCTYNDSTIRIPVYGQADYLPFIEADPEALEYELQSEDSLEQFITLGNSGTRDLEWHIVGHMKNNVQSDYYPFSYYQNIPKGLSDNRVGREVKINSGGPDDFGYTWVDSDEQDGLPFNWIDIRSSGTVVNGLADDNYTGPFPVGFSFPFYGKEETQFYISSNGFIGFGPPENYHAQNNYPMPQAEHPNNIIAWCWDDLILNSGQVYYQNFEDYLVIQFENYGEFGAGGSVNAQIILNRNGTILLQYLSFDNDFDTLHATVGIESQTGEQGLEVVFNNSFLHDSLAVQISENNWLSVSPQNGVIVPDGDQQLNIQANSKGLGPGTYFSYLQIFSNDEDQNPKSIPVRLTVDAQYINFSVDMSKYQEAGYFLPESNDSVFVTGSFNDWSIEPIYVLMNTGGSIYEAMLPMYGAVDDTIEYKYFIKTGDLRYIPNGGLEDSVGVYGKDLNSRGVILNGSSQSIPTVYFNNNDKGWARLTKDTDSLEVTLFQGDSTTVELVLG
ncbi:MAG: S8 family serine peptidase, partial [Calditrichaceae bacterium]